MCVVQVLLMFLGSGSVAAITYWDIKQPLIMQIIELYDEDRVLQG